MALLSFTDRDFKNICINVGRNTESDEAVDLANQLLRRARLYVNLFDANISDFRRSNLANAMLESNQQGQYDLAHSLLAYNELSGTDRVKFIMATKRHAAVAASGIIAVAGLKDWGWDGLPPIRFGVGTD